MSARYAIYFAPDNRSPWWNFGAHWLGRDEHDNAPLAQPLLPGLAPEMFEAITAEPRRYGFHATLKAPFRLSADHQESDLVARLNQLARTLVPAVMSPMRVCMLNNFVALLPQASLEPLDIIAAACVTELDDLRAPLLPAELARRSLAKLDSREAELLACYGYPYVLDRFRLHMTLTGPVDSAIAGLVMDAVSPKVDALNQLVLLQLDRLCLFVERSPGAAFHRLMDLRLHP